MLCVSEFMHYYCYKHHEVLMLEQCLFEELFHAMVKNKSRERLMQLDNLSYTKMKDDSRKKLHRMIYDSSQTEESINQAVIRTSAALGDFGEIKEAHVRGK